MIYLLIFAAWVLLVALGLALFSRSTSTTGTACTGDCNQGRACSCRERIDA